MNTINKLFQLISILGLAILLGLTSCEGPEGPAGPAGMTGANGANGMDGVDGADGKDGDQGPVGPQGEAGTANVKAYTYSVESTDYVTSPSSADWFEVTLNVSGITSDIVDYGLVHVYLQFPQGYRALPFTFHNSSTGHSTSMIFFHSIGQVLLRAYATDAFPTKYSGTYKVVVVEGTAGKNMPNLDWNKYEEVAAYYDLED